MDETGLSQQGYSSPANDTPTLINARGRPNRSAAMAPDHRERTTGELPYRHLPVSHLSTDGRFLFPTPGEDVRTHIDQDLQVLGIRIVRVVP